jgi:predicted CXXCH cytochrome family protein
MKLLTALTTFTLCFAMTQSAGLPTATAAATIDAFSGRPCADCHRSKLTAAFVHSALDGDTCTPCHKLSNGNHQSDHRFAEVKERSSRLCLECHGQALVQEKETRDVTGFRNGARNLHYLHSTMNVIPCLSCHDAHGSAQKFLIRPQTAGRKTGVTVKHAVTASGGSCTTSCHPPYDYARQ